MAVGPIDASRTVTNSPPAGPSNAAPANAADASKLNQLLAKGGSGAKPSADEISQVNQMKDRMVALIQKGQSMSDADKAELGALKGKLDTVAAKYPPSPEDATRLKDIQDREAKLQAKQPMTMADRQEMLDLVRQEDGIKFKAFRA